MHWADSRRETQHKVQAGGQAGGCSLDREFEAAAAAAARTHKLGAAGVLGGVVHHEAALGAGLLLLDLVLGVADVDLGDTRRGGGLGGGGLGGSLHFGLKAQEGRGRGRGQGIVTRLLLDMGGTRPGRTARRGARCRRGGGTSMNSCVNDYRHLAGSKLGENMQHSHP